MNGKNFIGVDFCFISINIFNISQRWHTNGRRRYEEFDYSRRSKPGLFQLMIFQYFNSPIELDVLF